MQVKFKSIKIDGTSGIESVEGHPITADVEFADEKRLIEALGGVTDNSEVVTELTKRAEEAEKLAAEALNRAEKAEKALENLKAKKTGT